MPSPLEHLPFPVILASYCIEFHERNTCSRCTPHGCPRLEAADLTLTKFRARRLARFRLLRRRSI